MSYTMQFTGDAGAITLMCKPFPEPSLTRGITWVQDAAGYWRGVDRDVDFYDARVTVFGTAATMNTFGEWLEANAREQFQITAFQGKVFLPVVNHAATVDAVILDRDRLNRVFWSPTGGVEEVTLTLRALSPSLVGTAGSLASLRLGHTFEADKSTEVDVGFYADGDAVTTDFRADTGRCVAKFNQSEAEAEAILKYIVGPFGRAQTIAFPSIGITYPFGVARGTNPNCKIKEVTVSREGLSRYSLEIEFVEAP